MDLNQIKQILNLVREHELSEFEIEQEGLRLKIRKDRGGVPVIAPFHHDPAPALAVSPHAAAVQGPAVLPDATGDGIELAVVKSPIVGTFYRSPEPGAAPFVAPGDTVKKGQVLCIIEAMKLMNEIESEFDGEIASIYVENGQPVQYGERLFAIKTK
jgi:acetyl-CoA carboxylase biotin carboxyl carrier protein